MIITTRLRRWLALRGVPALAPDSPEGRLVKATGVVRALGDPFVGPLSGRPCVVVHTRYRVGGATASRQPTRPPPASKIDRLLIQPFILELNTGHVVVDASHARLLVSPTKVENYERQLTFLAQHMLQHTSGSFDERYIASGREITVIGNALRDGVIRPIDDIAFRDVVIECKLVGNKQHPIVITDPT